MKKSYSLSLILMLLISLGTFAQSAETLQDIKNLKQLPNNVLTGGQPDKAGLQALKQSGINTVINFRGEGEFSDFNEAAHVDQLGMDYLHIPIDSKEALSRENVDRFRAALIEHDSGVFLHCGSGNRVGAMFALDAYWNQNKSAAEALKIGEEAGLTSLKGYVESVIAAQ